MLACACIGLAACGGGGGGGRIQRAEILQRCLSQKKLPNNLTRGIRAPGADQPADVVDTELVSPSAARLYVFANVDSAKSAAGAVSGPHERRDNVLIVFAHPPTDKDRAALDDCFSGRLSPAS
jgi:hypothetical protein